jgi:hypothetical protein
MSQATFERIRQLIDPNRPQHKIISSQLKFPDGTAQAISGYSNSTQMFYQPDAGKIAYIRRMIVHVQDTGGFDAAKYGNNLDFAFGIGVGVYTGSGATLVNDLVDGNKIKTNADWGHVCYDVSLVDFGIGDEFLQVRWTFGKSGQIIRLDGDRLDRFAITLDDNMTGLNDHRFVLQGYEVTK